MNISFFDVVVVGAGHAGAEASAAAANMGAKTLLITLNIDTICQMSCNPAMGGVAKGQIVREIDALGGYSGIVTDQSMIQFRMLNLSKGPAMWSPRAQCDKMNFSSNWRFLLESIPNLSIWQDEVTDIICDKCGRNMVIKFGPHGRFLACPGFPECRNTKPIIEKAGVKCPECGKDLIIRKTQKGRIYYGCEGYPDCKYMSWNKPAKKQ